MCTSMTSLILHAFPYSLERFTAGLVKFLRSWIWPLLPSFPFYPLRVSFHCWFRFCFDFSINCTGLAPILIKHYSFTLVFIILSSNLHQSLSTTIITLVYTYLPNVCLYDLTTTSTLLLRHMTIREIDRGCSTTTQSRCLSPSKAATLPTSMDRRRLNKSRTTQ